MLTCLDALFPTGVATAFSRSQAQAGKLAPCEEAFAGTLAPKRLAEFRHGRSCARAALERLGLDPSGIPAGGRREPLWPDGVVGSISHAGDAAAAVVSLSSRFAALGLDLEPATELDAELRPRVCRPEELSGLPAIPAMAGRRAKLLFSAKEAAYKALWPLLKQFLDFHDLEIRIGAGADSFTVISHAEGCPAEIAARIEGRFTEVDGLFATGVALRLRATA